MCPFDMNTHLVVCILPFLHVCVRVFVNDACMLLHTGFYMCLSVHVCVCVCLYTYGFAFVCVSFEFVCVCDCVQDTCMF